MATKLATKVYTLEDGTEARSATMAAKALVFRFADDTTKTVRLGDFAETVVMAAAWHGIAQKLGDAYAGAANVEEAKVRFQAVYEQLTEGDWVSESRGGGGGQASLLASAVAEALGQPLEDVQKTLAGMDKDTRKSIRNHKDVKPVLARMEAERAAARAAKAAKEAESADDETDLSSMF